MRFKRFYLAVAVFTFLSACSTSKLTTTSKINATVLESNGNYTQAVDAWSQYFAQTTVEQTIAEDFAHAAQTAFKAGNPTQAVSWFDQARFKNFADPAMYETLAKIYNSDNNLSKELSSLETYTEKFGAENTTVNARLFSIYSEIGETEKALKYWGLLNNQAKEDETNLADYLKINKKIENNEVCDSVANALLKINPGQADALEWNAKKYYWAGQNRYNREMKKYEENKTRKQYNVLLKELDLVTADFKKALPYLEKLWKQNPGKEYAGYFANIYARFGDEKKAEYYKKLMK